MKFKLKKIAGDASFRQFYRLTVGNKTSIIVLSQKDRFKNLVVYSFINQFLRKKGIFTPQLLNEFYNKGVMFGYKFLVQNGHDTYQIFLSGDGKAERKLKWLAKMLKTKH